LKAAKKDAPAFNVFAQIQDIENSEFGKKIMDTIALQLKNKSPISDIARMLAEIRQDLILQEHEADNLHNQQEHECAEEIAEYARRIDAAQVARDDAETEILLLHGEIANLQNDIAVKAKQLEIIDNRELETRANRETDAFNYEARRAQNEEVLSALDLILEKLNSITPNASAESVLVQLAKVGAKNPIMALAQLASGFNAESFRRTIEKLNQIRDDLQTQMEEESEAEEAAVADFNTIIGELTTTRKNIAGAKSEAETQLAQAEAALALQENILEESVEELAASLSGKAAKESICADWAATWERNKEVRQTELGLIAQVQNIIATKLDTVHSYFIERQ
jgi:chromosome segregation ATPase